MSATPLRHLLVGLLLGGTLLTLARPAEARRRLSFLGFRHTLDTNGFFEVPGVGDMKQWDWAVGLNVHFDSDPLTLRLRQKGELLETQITKNLGVQVYGSVNFLDWLQLGLEMPMTIGRKGSIFAEPDFDEGSVLPGDLRAQLKVVPLNERDHGISVGLLLGGTFPTGSDKNLYGTNGFDFLPSLVISRRIATSYSDYVLLSVQAGYRMTGKAEEVLLTVDDELTFGFGLGYTFGEPRVHLLLEVSGRTAADAPFEDQALTPVELRGGVRWFAGQSFALEAGVGGGVVPGYSATNLRLFGGFVYSHKIRHYDYDRDGVVDEEDGCPTEPEDKDGFKDEDGCPDLDHDEDGIPNESDACVDEPEDKDGFEDEDGCPDRDNDQDGMPDDRDQCPNRPENFNGLADDDGCPEDASEVAALPRKGGDGDKGCPKALTLDLLGRVYFGYNQDELLPDDLATVRDVAKILEDRPEIRKVEVAGHADYHGTHAYNLELSRRRAIRVRDKLVEQGIDRSRLVIRAYGKYHPADPGQSEEARAHNRRVELRVLETASGSDSEKAKP